MVYLIIDTNTWFYLANSYNPTNKKYENGSHFKVLKTLKELVDGGIVKLISSSIIHEEWKRNKSAAEELISRDLRTMKGIKTQLKFFSKKLSQKSQLSLNEMIVEFEKNIETEIVRNKKHIAEVELILFEKTELIEITNISKIKAADMAMAKMAPFIGDKSNSMSDALILLSAIEYLEENELFGASFMSDVEEYEPCYFPSVFISANKDDFSCPENADEFHPDLKALVSEIGMKYFRNIGQALNEVKKDALADWEIAMIDLEFYDELDGRYYSCETCDSREGELYNIVDLGEPIEIDSDIYIGISPNQLDIFGGKYKDSNSSRLIFNTKTIQIGSCENCSTIHFRCQYCQNVDIIYGNMELIRCDGCDLIYEVSYSQNPDVTQFPVLKIVDEK